MPKTKSRKRASPRLLQSLPVLFEQLGVEVRRRGSNHVHLQFELLDLYFTFEMNVNLVSNQITSFEARVSHHRIDIPEKIVRDVFARIDAPLDWIPTWKGIVTDWDTDDFLKVEKDAIMAAYDRIEVPGLLSLDYIYNMASHGPGLPTMLWLTTKDGRYTLSVEYKVGPHAEARFIGEGSIWGGDFDITDQVGVKGLVDFFKTLPLHHSLWEDSPNPNVLSFRRNIDFMELPAKLRADIERAEMALS